MNKNIKVQATPSRLSARIAAWPKFAQQYVPMTKAENGYLKATAERDIMSRRIMDAFPDAPKEISAATAKRLIAFSILHRLYNEAPKFRDEIREAERLEAAALLFIQEGYLSRWLLSDQFEKGGKPVVVCAKAALMRRLVLPLDRAVPEVFAMLYARTARYSDIEAAQDAQVVDHAGR